MKRQHALMKKLFYELKIFNFLTLFMLSSCIDSYLPDKHLAPIKSNESSSSLNNAPVAVDQKLNTSKGIVSINVISTKTNAIHSSDLGWVAGQDITEKFSSLLINKIVAGDELVLDHIYRISGGRGHQLPDDFTLSAKNGAGFEVTDVKGGSESRSGTLLHMGNRTTLRNLTITYLNTPPLYTGGGMSHRRGIDYFKYLGILANKKSDIRIENCRFKGSITNHLKISSSPRAKIIGSHFMGGFWTVVMGGNTSDAVFDRCVFEGSQGDGIKTIGRGGPDSGVVRTLVNNCVFQDNGRDGIDTTGGFKDSIVRNTIFRRLFKSMDIKSPYNNPEDLISPNYRNSNILVENCKFTDTRPIWITLGDRGHLLDPKSAQEYATHDVDINDCIFENTASKGKMSLAGIQGGHSIRFRNATFLGNIVAPRILHTYHDWKSHLTSKEVGDSLNHSVSWTIGSSGKPGTPGDKSIPFTYGPQPHGERTPPVADN